MTGTMLTSPDYQAFLESLKERVRTARLRAAQSLNQEIVLLYWSIGCDILARQAELGWGAGVIDRLSEDLRREFPDMKGFSPRNLRYMKAFAQAWQDEAILQQRVAKLPWGHIVRILDGAREPAARQFYVEQALACGWSRDVLVLHMDRRLHERQGQAATNFDRTLPSSTSDLAVQTLKDPFVFDFLGLGDEAHERELSQAFGADWADVVVHWDALGSDALGKEGTP